VQLMAAPFRASPVRCTTNPMSLELFIVSLWSLSSVTTPPSYGGHYGPFALAFCQRGGPAPRRRPPPN